MQRRPGPLAPSFSLRTGLSLLGALCLAVLAGLHRLGWKLGEAWFFSDASSYRMPRYDHAAARLAAGEVPLWNPFEYCGIPFLATLQTSVFYPFVRLVYAFGSGEAAYAVLFYLHLLIGVAATLVLMRQLGCRLWPSLFASTWVVTPLWMLGIYEHSVLFGGVVWIPLLLSLVLQLVQRPRLRTAGLLGLTAAVQFFSGYPPVIVPTLCLLAAALPAALWERRGELGGRGVSRLVAALSLAVFLAGLLASVQLLPAAGVVADTDRGSRAFAHRDLVEGNLSDDIPLMLGLPPVSVTAGSLRTWRAFGPLIIVLCVLALLLRPREPIVWAVAAIVVVATLVPAWVFFRLPPYQIIRFGVEWTFAAPFVVYLLAGLGLDAGLRRGAGSPWLAPVAALLVLLQVTSWNWSEATRRHPNIRAHERRTLPREVAEACGLDGGLYRIHWPEGQRYGAQMRDGFRSIVGYEPLLPARAAALYRELAVANFGREPKQWETFGLHPGVFARLSLRCVVASVPTPRLRELGFEPLMQVGPSIHVYARETLPRARMVYAAEHVASGEDALARILSESVDPATTLILEGESDAALAAEPSACAGDPAASVVLRVDRPEEQVIEVSSACAGHLFLSDAWSADWQARVDGQPAELQVADYLFRAVRLAAGAHRVELSYRPHSFAWGTGLSILGLLALAILLGLPARMDPLRPER